MEWIVDNTDGKTPQFVFTLNDDAPVATPAAHTEEDSVADWERSLERLRQHKQQSPAVALPMEDIFTHAEAEAKDNSAVTRAQAFLRPTPRTGAGTAVGAASSPADGQTTAEEVILDPVQRERVYRAYLQEWQHKTSLEQEQEQSALNDTAVLFQEDWLAAQNCLTHAAADAPEVCTVRLNRQNQAEVLPQGATIAAGVNEPVSELPEHDDSSALTATAAAEPESVIHVHLHVVEPQGVQARAVSCVSEQDVVQQLVEKLRPHLADTMAGMMRVAIQKHMAHVIADIQKQLLADIPSVVDEVLNHNLARALQQIKKTARR